MNRRLLRAVSHDTGDGTFLPARLCHCLLIVCETRDAFQGIFLPVLPFELSRCDSIVRLRLPTRNVISSHFILFLLFVFFFFILQTCLFDARIFPFFSFFAFWDYVSSDFHVSKSRLQSFLQLSV